MSTFSVPVVTVKTVTTHPNADALDILSFEEVAWQCVDKRDARKPGDLVVYIPIDSIVNTNRPEFSFLAPKAKPDGTFRIRTIRLRGEISQGLVIDVPVGRIFDYKDDVGSNLSSQEHFYPGCDVAAALDIVKYEPPAEHTNAQAAGSYPSWCEKSDAERYQNFNRNIQPFADEEFYLTLKMDGTSCTIYYDEDKITEPTTDAPGQDGVGVCSRNWDLREHELGADKYFETGYAPRTSNTYWTVARNADLTNKIKAIANILGSPKVGIQGEICGPGIQKNKYGLTTNQFFAFDISMAYGATSSPTKNSLRYLKIFPSKLSRILTRGRLRTIYLRDLPGSRISSTPPVILLKA
jgi:RNA ligase (TIGR02306 family)